MDDLIRRQDAIDAMLEAYEDLDAEWIIKRLPSAQQWIPCTERLPEEGQEVLFSTKTGTVQIGKYSDRGCLNSWFSYCDKCRAWNNVVNAWMPLPEPYHGGE